MVTRQTSKDLQADCVHIWSIDLDTPNGYLSGLLSADETRRAEVKRLTRARERFILVHGAKRYILGEYLGVSGEHLEFITYGKGKPALNHPEFDIEFNLSHCEGMALLAVAKRIPVGIDLERIRNRPSQLQIAQRMFPELIYNELKQLPPDQFDTAFFRYWTELEARAKCVGDGIFSKNKGQIDISTSHFSPQDGWMACLAAKGVDPSRMQLKHFVF